VPYCEPADLLVGDATVDGAQLTRFVGLGADEIDEKLGFEYVLPIPEGVPAHVTLTLKRCNVLIGSGRYILAQAIGSEQDGNHAYGHSLLKEGQGILASIVAGQIDLTGVPRIEVVAVDGNEPRIIQKDATSPLDAFYSNTGRSTDIWAPG
jgi:hypothetical protein